MNTVTTNKWAINKWLIVRLLLTGLAAWQGVMSGDNWLPARPATPLLMAGMLAYGVIAVPVVVWAQRLNPRNRPVWHFPSWRRNPLTLRDPMQFFHMIGFLFLAAHHGYQRHAECDSDHYRHGDWSILGRR